VNLVIATLEFAAIINIGGANTEHCCAVRNIRTVSNIQAIARSNGSPECSEFRILSAALQFR
jgi:hypothetical protein